ASASSAVRRGDPELEAAVEAKLAKTENRQGRVPGASQKWYRNMRGPASATEHGGAPQRAWHKPAGARQLATHTRLSEEAVGAASANLTGGPRRADGEQGSGAQKEPPPAVAAQSTSTTSIPNSDA